MVHHFLGWDLQGGAGVNSEGIYIQEGSVEIFRTVCIAVHKPDCLNLYPHLHRLPSAAQCPGKRQMGLLSREGDDEAEEPEVHQAKQM